MSINKQIEFNRKKNNFFKKVRKAGNPFLNLPVPEWKVLASMHSVICKQI